MQYTTFLRWGIYAGLFAILFVPFIIANGGFLPNMFFPYITGKNFVFRILVELVFLLYVILALREPQYRPKSSYILWAVGAFVLWLGISTVLSVDPIKSFWSNFERMDGYITLLHLGALFLVAGSVLSVGGMWKRFLQTSVAASMIMGIYGLLQILNVLAISSQSGPRVDVTFGNAIYTGVYMLFNIFFTLFLLAREGKSRGMQAVYGVALVLQATTLIYSQSRGPVLGVLGGLVVAALYIMVFGRESQWKPLRRTSAGAIAVILLLAGGVYAARNTDFVRNSSALSRLASVSLSEGTVQSRLDYIWPIAVKGSMEKPVFGWGEENFSFIFNKYYPPQMYGQEQWFDRAHNQFLDWLVAGGVPAFLLYVSLFVLAVLATVRSSVLLVPEKAALLGLLAAYAFNNAFVFDNVMSVVYFYLLLAFLHSYSWQPLPRAMVMTRPISDRGIAVLAPIVAVVVLWGVWAFNGNGLARAQTMIDAINTTNLTTGGPRPPQENIAAFKKSLTQGNLGKQELTEQLFQFAAQASSAQSFSPALRQEVHNLAVTSGDAMLAIRKNDARLESFEGMFYAQYGEFDQGLVHLQNALKLSPNKQSLLFQLAQVYLQKNDVKSALPILKQAFDLAPAFDQARFMYASALYIDHQNASADALLTERFGTTNIDNDQLLQVYTTAGLTDRVITILKTRVAADEKNPDKHFSLAEAYFRAGDKANAIAELQRVAQLRPSAAADIQSLISQLQSGTLKAQ